MTLLRTCVIALLLAAATSMSVNAAPNTGKFRQSSEAVKQQMVDCAFYKNMLEIAERDADQATSRKDKAKYAKEADGYWAKGESLGCGWAA